jgi:hypothetical protein
VPHEDPRQQDYINNDTWHNQTLTSVKFIRHFGYVKITNMSDTDSYLTCDTSSSDVSSYVTLGFLLQEFLSLQSPNVPKSRMSETQSGHETFDLKDHFGRIPDHRSTIVEG